MTNQPKKGRPRSENPMVHTAIALPRDLLKRLRSDAEASDRRLSTEIRARLHLTYAQEGLPSDPETNHLLADIKLLADNLARDLGTKWHQHPYVRAAFKSGVAALLAQYQAKGPEGPDFLRPNTPIGTSEPDDPPDVVGRTHARLIEIAKLGDEERKLANGRKD